MGSGAAPLPGAPSTRGGAEGRSPAVLRAAGLLREARGLPCTHPPFGHSPGHVSGSAPAELPSGGPAGAERLTRPAAGAVAGLTVSILAVNPIDAAVGQDLDVEADAHVAVEAPQPLDAQEVVAVAGGIAALGREASDGAGEKSRVPAALAGSGREATRGRPATHRPWPQQPQEQRRQQRRGERHPGLAAGSHGPPVAPKMRCAPSSHFMLRSKKGRKKKIENQRKAKKK